MRRLVFAIAILSHLIAVPVSSREVKGPAGGGVGTVDHPGCAERFHLAPGERVSRRQSLVVPDIGVGEASLNISVQVVHPRDCAPLYGCYDTTLKAPAIRVSLRRPGATRL